MNDKEAWIVKITLDEKAENNTNNLIFFYHLIASWLLVLRKFKCT